MIEVVKDFILNASQITMEVVSKPFYTETIVGNSIYTLFGYASIVAIAALITLFLIAITVKFCQSESIRKLLTYLLPCVFVIIWIMGFMVYEVGMYIDDGILGLLRVAPMATVHAFGMFVFDSDVSEVHDPFFNDMRYMTMFSLVHFLAALFSLFFILRFIGFYISSRIKLKMRSILACWGIYRPNKLNIFWGINKDSLLLAEDIKNRGFGDVVFVRIMGDEESHTSTVGVERILNLVKLNDDEIKTLYNNGFYVTSLFNNAICQKEDDIFSIEKTFGLGSLSKLLGHTKERINIFLFDDVDSININNLMCLVKDPTLHSSDKVHLYFKARNNATNNIIEHTITDNSSQKCHCNIHLVDTAYLSVADLMMNKESHPVNVVNIEKDGTVSSSFNALLIGLGQTGECVFRYLYEFSAFSNKEMLRSECNFTIVDKKATSLWTSFVASKQALTKLNCVNCVDAEIGSTIYWDEIKQQLDDLNYVVIATGNDEENLNTAIDIYRTAVRKRRTLDNFLIYFRIYSAENEERIQRIVEGYNNVVGHNILCTFGTAEYMLSYDNIVNERLINEAKEFNANYEGKSSENADDLWKKLSVEALYLKNNKKYSNYSHIEAITESRNKKEQNISNSQHRHTKIRLMGEDFIKKLPMINREYLTINYVGLSSEQTRVMDIMACTEHLRWLAKQELLGYSYGEEKNYIRLTHPYMVEWNNSELPDDIKSWDYNVVDTSVKMYKKETSH